jgi:hypothetical protein
MKLSQKGFAHILILLIIVVILGGAIYYFNYTSRKSVVEAPTYPIKTYLDPEYGFSFNYPSDWILDNDKHDGITNIGIFSKPVKEDSVPDFNVFVCKISTELCAKIKNNQSDTINVKKDVVIDGKKGLQGVSKIDNDVRSYSAVIERTGILYVVSHSYIIDLNSTTTGSQYPEYPNSFSDQKIKAIFDSLKIK